MKRFLVSLHASVCLALVLSSCSSRPESDGTLPNTEASKGPESNSNADVADSKKTTDKKIIEWNYSDKGPLKWGALDPDYVLCGKGLEQSPLDLVWSKPLAERELSFFYQYGAFQIERSAHKVQISFSKGNHALIAGERWNLVAMQLHSPAEHTFSGKAHPLEVHLIHYNEAASSIGIVAVPFKVGRPNLGLESLLAKMPDKVGSKVLIDNAPLNPSLFLPLATTHYFYKGSMTTPPCVEGVSWSVLNSPLEVSEAQLKKLREVVNGNARPVQPANHRKPTNFNKY